MNEESREQSAGSALETLIRDLRLGARALLRDKPFALTVILTLAVGIAANTATFAIVRSVLLEPLPVPESENIVLMANSYPNAGVGNLNLSSGGDYYDRLRDVHALEPQSMFNFYDQTIEVGGVPQQVRGMLALPSFFPLIQVQPAMGRAFTEEEGEDGADRKVILGHGLWSELYNGDPGALGRQLRLSGRDHTIVGVMPEGFTFIDPEVRFWRPLAFNQQQRNARHSNNWYNIGRLKPGSTIAQAQAQVDALNAANLERFPELREAIVAAGFHTKVEPLQEMVVGDVKAVLYLLWGGAVCVLLIGALNIANLAFVRLTLRRKELATRVALGAGSAHIIRQFIVENMLLCVTGGLAGLGLGAAVLRGLKANGLERLPRAEEVQIDWQVAVLVMAMAALVGLVLGVMPLGQTLRVDLNKTLRDGGRGGTGGKGARHVRQSLVVAQIGFAVVLLVGAGLLLASFRHLLGVDPGFDTERVLTASTSAPSTRYPNNNALRALNDRSLEAIRALPGVEAAGAVNFVPLGAEPFDSVVVAEGHTQQPGESFLSPPYLVATPGYFQAMGIEVLEGRGFNERDGRDGPDAVIIDEWLAEHFWPGASAVGRRMFQPQSPDELSGGPTENTKWMTVVGVVRSVGFEDVAGRGDFVGGYYMPYAQMPYRNFSFVVKTAAEPASVAGAMRSAIAAIDPELAVFDIRSMDQRRELSLASRRTAMTLAGVFGAVALLLSAIGIYGVLAYYVTQRKREIGVRVALGCTRARVIGLVLREGTVLAGAGLLLGVAGAVALRRAIESELYGVSALDPLVYLSVVGVLGAVVLLASALPARRAAAVNPTVVLSE